MDSANLIKDLGTVLLAGGVAGVICKRMGLSAIVGYLLAGMVIGPHTPPFSLIAEEERIKELSEVGLVFVMFAIGLHLSLSKMGKMGLATIGATFLGAFFMLNFTLILGHFLDWTAMQSMFVAAMLMVSSSAVIAKLMQEYNLNHERAAQMALAITIVEDVVAVIMLTLLVSHETGGGGVGGVIGVLGAFVVLLIGGGLLLMPRVLRRLEARGDPELQTVIVAGLLLLLSFFTVKAGYSLALGAFLFGAIVAEMRQKHAVEKSFESIRFLFSSVFFVSIGMMIDLGQLKEVWLTVLILCTFSLVFRPIACGFALILVGIAPREARRGGLLLTPLGEFTFIIAAAGIGASILPQSFYPLAVSLSVLTVLITPILNRYADPILKFADEVEPRWVTKAITAYHGWLRQLQSRPPSTLAWKLLRGRAFQVALECMFVSGLLIFSKYILAWLETTVVAEWLEGTTLRYVFWSVMAVFVLIPVVAVWRNISAIALITAEAIGGADGDRRRLPKRLIESSIKALGGLGMLYWLYAVLPVAALPGWGWAVIAGAGVVLAVVFSNRLVYWHSSWENSLHEVLAEDARMPEEVRAEARVALDESLGAWKLRLEECVVPDAASYAGQSLAQLAIPSRFSCSVLEVERNGHLITVAGSDLRLYPGDKILLLGPSEKLEEAREFLHAVKKHEVGEGEFGGSVLETFVLPTAMPAGRSLADLQIARDTGVRIAGIRRAGDQIINPTGAHTIEPGDNLLVVGSLVQLRAFGQWVKTLASS
ncbi:sodium:proton exchanger [Opitutaceae bacterium TAV4]|nr:sodium:proton exchanger [Opitutaceae bacterium TAV4]RRK00546.1 sodium:proton exchanger [Opitutaceae bacterium TAV3]